MSRASSSNSSNVDASRRVADWIARLGLVPHPEGGWYRETSETHLPARFASGGKLMDRTTKTFIRELLRNLVDWTRQVAQRPKT